MYSTLTPSSVLCVLGLGAQGKAGAEAIMAVRDIKKVIAFDPYPGMGERYLTWLKEVAPQVEGVVVSDADEAVAQADIILTCTPSKTPLFAPSSVKPGTHITAVGAYTPEMAEIPSETVAAAHVVVDYLEAIKVEGGDIIRAVRDGHCTWDHVVGEVGALAKGEIEGRTSPSQITMFKTVGTAVQDVVVGHEICVKAEEQNLGTVVPDLWNH
ncbi:ornithine cyclodeaminase/mu-crystallin [Kipferlia bialata]|uniref:Ornithine cyclodeaminase/mu-crystallin n=1 Tax=Kipferlia bialata TaxID=797122 RepID=A0A9K3DB14_9EUKA|nr:ornithine cyclodeaminase/mu-crystallin [Kipferlia bialata]|eukprot:g13380.t1